MKFGRGYNDVNKELNSQPITRAQQDLIEDIEELLEVEYDWENANKFTASEFIRKYKSSYDEEVKLRSERWAALKYGSYS